MKTYKLQEGAGTVTLDPLAIKEVSKERHNDACTVCLEPHGFLPLKAAFHDVLRDIIEAVDAK